MEEAIKKVRDGSFEIGLEEIQLDGKLGEGAMGAVYKCKWKGSNCAAKKLKSAINENSQEYKNLVMELDVLASVPHHPNIVRFMGACVQDPNNLVILQELMEGPNLETFLAGRPSGFDLGRTTVYGWTLDLLRALEHLHNRNPVIIHRDLKPDNLLLSKDLCTLKLADFGTSKRVWGGEKKTLARVFSVAGTPRYMAPEVFGGQSTYTEKADIYSASLVIYYLLSGRKPTVDIRTNRYGRPDTGVAKARWGDMVDLIVRMWDYRPPHRPSASECVAQLLAMPDAPDLSRGAAPDDDNANLLPLPPAVNNQLPAEGGDKKKLLGSTLLYKLIRANSFP